MVSVRHIALFVTDLREAEAFYRDVFEMELLMREALLDDRQWYTLPPDKGWHEAASAGVDLTMLALQRDDFILALLQGEPVPERTVLEIGIYLPAGDIPGVRARLPRTAWFMEQEGGDLMFGDPFGYRWHLWPEGVAFTSNGESAGRWLEV